MKAASARAVCEQVRKTASNTRNMALCVWLLVVAFCRREGEKREKQRQLYSRSLWDSQAVINRQNANIKKKHKMIVENQKMLSPEAQH